MKYSLTASLIAAACTVGAHATINQVSDPSQLNQGPYTVEDFEDDTFEPGATYTSGSGGAPTLASAANFANGVTPSGVQGLGSPGFPDTIIVNLDQPASSGGLWFGNDDLCCSTGFTATLTLRNGMTVLAQLQVEANMNDNCDQFIGWNGDEAVTSMEIDFAGEGLFLYIDDVYFNVGGPSDDCPEDINNDGTVDIQDLLALLAAWGPCDDSPNGGCTEGFTCGQGQAVNCPDVDNPECFCFTGFDGNPVCTTSSICSDLETCFDGNCPPGTVCTIDTCCIDPVCAIVCPDVSRGQQVFEPGTLRMNGLVPERPRGGGAR